VSVWRTLGIKRTDDVAEIRRAYAKKLKATDVDADPAAFIALRAALEQALADASYRREHPHEAEPAPEPEPFDPAPPEAEDVREHPDARFHALEALLFPPEGTPLPDPAALAAALDAILHHPEMARVDHSAGVEHWLAETLYYAAPLSDPIIPVAIDHFHWEERSGRWDQPMLFEELVKRRASFGLVEQLADPAHPLHKAWLELTSARETLAITPPGRAGQVARLLAMIREEAPAAEARLSPHRVAMWEDRLAAGVSGGLKIAMILFWGILILFRVATAVYSPSSSSSTAPPITISTGYADPAADLDRLIDTASGGRVDLDELERRNPPLYERLMARWRRARDRHEPPFFLEADARTLLQEGARESLRGGGSALQADFWRLRRDELAWLQRADVADCDRSLQGAPVQARMPPEYNARRRELLERALGETPRDPPAPLSEDAVYRFVIPEAAMAAAGRSSGLRPDLLDAALNNRATPAARCTARIALIEAALALPERERERLLRDMSRGL
jgi:hypothetical protein